MLDDSPAFLRERFARLTDFSWQGYRAYESCQISAAVLVPLLLRPSGTQVLLTRRTDHLHHHAGQICFPGGQMEVEDASLSMTALREAREEVGLQPDEVELMGCLPDFGTPSGFRITPVVGLLAPSVRLEPDPFEVAEIFEVPLTFLAEHRNYQHHRIRLPKGERQVQAVPYAGRFIWGATAGILYMLADFLSAGH